MKEAFSDYNKRYINGTIHFRKANLIWADVNTDLKNKNILVMKEQGLGDEMMFSLALEDLSKTVKSAQVEVSDSLYDLFCTVYNYSNIIFISSKNMNTLSLNNLEIQTCIGDIFSWYYLRNLKSPKSLKIQEMNENGKIGICCSSLPEGSNAQEKNIMYTPFLKNPEQFIIVQKLTDKHPKKPDNINIINTSSFLDTYNQIKDLKCVISIDTSVAHLCGMLGIRCYVIMSDYYDWRWKHLDLYSSCTVHQEKDLPELLLSINS